MEKTQAMRVLEARGIAYQAVEYDASGEFHSADEAAALLGVDAATVYKTLVVLREGGGKPLLVMVPAACEIDLKLLASEAGVKKVRMAKQREAEELTGMQAGGISALALRRPQTIEVLLDVSAREIATIHVSAGRRGLDLAVRVDDLVAVTGARWVRAVSAQADTLPSACEMT